MKQLLVVAVFLSIIFVSGYAVSGPPAIGIYTSTDLGGSMDPGRYSESWMPAGDHGQVGNTIHAMSWDGAVLGMQWVLSCPAIAAPPSLVSDTRVGGTGEVVWQTMYAGGALWLSKDGPWGDGSQDYTATVSTFMIATTYQYVNSTLLGIRANVTMSAMFDGFDNCIQFSINNSAMVGNTDMMPLPPNYPLFLDSFCNTGILDRGHWGTVTEIALQITGQCTVPVRDLSWGEVKARYSE